MQRYNLKLNLEVRFSDDEDDAYEDAQMLCEQIEQMMGVEACVVNNLEYADEEC